MLIERHPVRRALVFGGGNLSQAVLALLSRRALRNSAVAALTCVGIRSSGRAG